MGLKFSDTGPEIQFSRRFSPPNGETFKVKPIGGFVSKYMVHSSVSIDPFARNRRWCTYTNDLDPTTRAECHMDARKFLRLLGLQGVRAELIILDPPYSPRQISDCYKVAGRRVTMADTQNIRLYDGVRDLALMLCTENAVVLSFGWNSSGMGKKRGFQIIEVLLCNHGAARNDTICIAERRVG